MQQANDYRIEAQTLATVLEPLNDDRLKLPTLVKGWTIEDIIGHLYIFDAAALLTLDSSRKFREFYVPIQTALSEGKTFLQTLATWLDGLQGRKLFKT